jgi:hypothetical protein
MPDAIEEVQSEDEAAYVVQPADEILRRIKLPPPGKNENDLIKTLPNGKRQITRLAFRPDPKRDIDGLSVNIIGLAESVSVLYNTDTHLAVKLAAHQCFSLALTITHDPLSKIKTDPEYSHALMNDLMDQKDIQATLADQCEIIA